MTGGHGKRCCKDRWSMMMVHWHGMVRVLLWYYTIWYYIHVYNIANNSSCLAGVNLARFGWILLFWVWPTWAVFVLSENCWLDCSNQIAIRDVTLQKVLSFLYSIDFMFKVSGPFVSACHLRNYFILRSQAGQVSFRWIQTLTPAHHLQLSAAANEGPQGCRGAQGSHVLCHMMSYCTRSLMC